MRTVSPGTGVGDIDKRAEFGAVDELAMDTEHARFVILTFTKVGDKSLE